MKKIITVQEYRENFGFRLQKVHTIFESGLTHLSGEDWFNSPVARDRGLENLIFFPEKKQGDDEALEVVYLVEQLDNNFVHCTLVESDNGWREAIGSGKRIIKVHQMYRKFWEDHVSLNFQ
ncbi:MAG: hypothetical protein PHC89_02325 [Candidatus Pacebacteria bacterium]|nr:hypothetical protein [Candidatus Paceibacterota bacterium]